jgi:hypothetical protein
MHGFFSAIQTIPLVLSLVEGLKIRFSQPANWAMRRVIILEFRKTAATRWLLQADSDRSRPLEGDL